VLAQDASQHLRAISDDRYELALEEAPAGRDSTFRRVSQPAPPTPLSRPAPPLYPESRPPGCNM